MSWDVAKWLSSVPFGSLLVVASVVVVVVLVRHGWALLVYLKRKPGEHVKISGRMWPTVEVTPTAPRDDSPPSGNKIAPTDDRRVTDAPQVKPTVVQRRTRRARKVSERD